MLKVKSATVSGSGTRRRYVFELSDGTTAESLGTVAKRLDVHRSTVENIVDRHGLDEFVTMINARPALGNGEPPEYVVSHRKCLNFTLYMMDNGQELKSGQLAKILGVQSAHVKRVLSEKGEAGLNAMLSGDEEGFDPIDRGFPRWEICIKNSVECKRYSECQDARLFDDNWQKPEGECYEAAPRKPLASYRSPMADIEMYCLGYSY